MGLDQAPSFKKRFYHRKDMMKASGRGYAMHDKRIYQPTEDARKTIFSYPPCIGHHGLFAVITMYLMHAIKKAVQTFTLLCDFDDKKECKAWVTTWGSIHE